MGRQMLINAVHSEQKRMAIVDDGKLLDYNIQMAVKDPITGNLYKGIVMKVERGLQAAFVNYGGKRDGFLPLRDVSQDYFTERRDGDNGHEGGHNHGRQHLKVGQEVLVQVMREVSERKGALLTTYISMPGRYIVLLPNKQGGGGISRKIEDEEDRKRLKEIMDQIKLEEGMGFIIRTAGMNRTKQELARDYQHLTRLWKEIQKDTKETPAPAVIYQESDFGVCSLRDYFTSEIEEVLVDDTDTFRKMRAYCKTVSPRTVKIIKLYKDMVPIFDKYSLEDQIRVIYQERVDLKSGGYIIINPTEAMITIDVNSGRGSNKRNVEETAFRTNMEAAEEIARQLRLRDLGGLIVIDFIDMMDRQHQLEIERAFKKALSVDRSRIQMSKISKFGMLELSRQKKQSTIQEISYTACPFCKGTGLRPSLEYTALSAFRKIESKAVKGNYAGLKVAMPHAISDYLLNQKRLEISKLESTFDMSIYIYGQADMQWDDVRIEFEAREAAPEGVPENEKAIDKAIDKAKESRHDAAVKVREGEAVIKSPEVAESAPEPAKKKSRRRSRHRRKKPVEALAPLSGAVVDEAPADESQHVGETTPSGVPVKETPDNETNKGGPKAIKSPAGKPPAIKSPLREAPAGEKSTGETSVSEAAEGEAPVPKAPRRKRRPPSRTAMQRKKDSSASLPSEGDVAAAAPGEEKVSEG
ncbi:MAG: Rne/Rng family ribonuclease [Syntrophales bacterium]